jgi:hypothetical protein
MGGIDIARSAFSRFREKVRIAGFHDLHINVMARGAQGVPDLRGTLASLDVKSVTNYTWAHCYNMSDFPATEYRDVLENAPFYWSKVKDAISVPLPIGCEYGVGSKSARLSV